LDRDQVIGWLIFAACLVVAALYLMSLFVPSAICGFFGVSKDALRFWAVAIVVLIAFLAVVLIGAWIGWTMATTPPPKPVEPQPQQSQDEPEIRETGKKD